MAPLLNCRVYNVPRGCHLCGPLFDTNLWVIHGRLSLSLLFGLLVLCVVLGLVQFVVGDHLVGLLGRKPLQPVIVCLGGLLAFLCG